MRWHEQQPRVLRTGKIPGWPILGSRPSPEDEFTPCPSLDDAMIPRALRELSLQARRSVPEQAIMGEASGAHATRRFVAYTGLAGHPQLAFPGSEWIDTGSYLIKMHDDVTQIRVCGHAADWKQ